MSTNVGYATLSVIPSARGFRGLLQKQVGGDIARVGASSGSTFSRAFSSSASSGLRSFASSARSTLKGLVVAAGAASTGFATLGLKTAAGLQTAQIGFETLLHSAKRATTFIASLRKFAVATPFEVEGLIQNARSLLGVGTAARDVIPTLTALGDTTAALGLNQDQFNGILRAYTQIASKGKVQAEELLQISENGIPAVQLLAKALGLTVPQLQAMTAAGTLTANVALPALLKQLNKDYGGSMSRQFNTLTGVFNNFKESAKLALADGVQPLLPLLQNALPRATTAVGNGIKAASAALAGFIRGVQGAGAEDGKVSFFERLGAGARQAVGLVRDAVQAVLPTLRRFGNFLTDKVAPIIVAYYRKLFPALKKSFQQIGQTISENQNTFRALGKIFTDLILPALSAVGIFVAKSLGPIFKTFVSVLRNFVIPLIITFADTVLGVLDLIISGAAAAFGWVPGLGGKLKAANRSFDKFAVGVNNSLRNIERLVQVDVVIRVRQTTADITGGFDGESLTPQQAAAKQRQRVVDAATKASKAAKDAAKAKAADLNSTFGGLGSGAMDALATGLATGKDKAAKAAKDAAQKVIDTAKQALADAKQDLRDFAASIRDSLRSFGDLTGIGSTGAAATPASLQRFLDKQLATIVAFRKNLQTLARRGISDSLLTKIASAGVESGGPVAAALVRARGAAFDNILASDAKIDRQSRLTGAFVSQRTLGDEVAQARIGVVNVNIQNAVPERASTTAPKAVRLALIKAGA